MEPTPGAKVSPERLDTVLGLIEEARKWLPRKGTDQWQELWPDVKGRDARVRRGLEVGATWIVWAGRRPATTVTVAKTPNMDVWRDAECNFDEPAVYAHRLIIDRQYAGWGLGADLIDWAGVYGHREWGAKWIRIDVWTTNRGLHEYYMNKGFEPCGTAPDPSYPSGMLFRKPLSEIGAPVSPLFEEIDRNLAPAPALVPRSPREPRPAGGWPGQAAPGRTRRAAFRDSSRWYVSPRSAAAQARQRTRRRSP